MEYLKSIDDYLFEEIQKHLNELEELTTNVVYKQIVYKIIIDYIDNEDIISYAKSNLSKKINVDNLDYLDYSKKSNTFVLDKIIETLKFVKDLNKIKIIDNPDKLFTSILNNFLILDKESKTIFKSELRKSIIKDNYTKSIFYNKLIKSKITDNQNNYIKISKV